MTTGAEGPPGEGLPTGRDPAEGAAAAPRERPAGGSPTPDSSAAAGPHPADPSAAADRPAAEAPARSDEEDLAHAAEDDVKLLVEAARFATAERVQAVVEALLFAAEKPLDLEALAETTRFSRQQLDGALAALQRRYPGGDSGVVLTDLGGRWQLRTDTQVGPYVRRMLQVKPMRLTRAAMETLAMVAYRQPITRPELEDLRGVDCGAVTKALLERKLIRILGKKDEPGRPILFGTSREFLELFNLRDLTQLPTLREFQELSEESRQIVEEEVPDAPKAAGLTELAHDPAVERKLSEAAQESDAALDQLEKAMAVAEEKTRTAAAVLAPQAEAAAQKEAAAQAVPPGQGPSLPGDPQTSQAGSTPAAVDEPETGSEGER